MYKIIDHAEGQLSPQNVILPHLFLPLFFWSLK